MGFVERFFKLQHIRKMNNLLVDPMNDKPIKPPIQPLWVAIALWGIKSRLVAVVFVWLCVAFGVGVLVARFWFGLDLFVGPEFLFLGLLFLLTAALWDWAAIR